MASSADRAAAVRQIGLMLSAAEAGQLADALEAGDTTGAALALLGGARKTELAGLLHAARLGPQEATLVLRAIEGARSAASSTLEPLWTMPGLLVHGSPLTSSVPALVRAATTSVSCSTYNFQRTSGLWQALHDIVGRPRSVRLRVYLDANAAKSTGNWAPLTAAAVAAWLKPAAVFRTVDVGGKPVRNHAKFLVIDHRFVLITSANFSASAELRNVELGVKIDNAGLAESIEREVRRAEEHLYERVATTGGA